jgi:hypothetical protein
MRLLSILIMYIPLLPPPAPLQALLILRKTTTYEVNARIQLILLRSRL